MNGSWRNGTRVPPPPDPYQSLDGLAKAAFWLLLADVILTTVSLISSANVYSILLDIRDGHVISQAQATAVENRDITIALLQVPISLFTAAVFIAWFRRAYRNLWTLGVTWFRFKAGWAVGAWFTPFLNLVRPKEMANDIWRASDPELPMVLDGPALGRPVAGFINAWWALVVVSGIGYRSSLQSEPSVEEALRNVGAAMFSQVLWVVAGILLILYVRRVTDRQGRRAEIRRAAYASGLAASPVQPSSVAVEVQTTVAPPTSAPPASPYAPPTPTPQDPGAMPPTPPPPPDATPTEPSQG